MDKKMKFIESLSVDGWSVKTDKGYQCISQSNKTIKYTIWKIFTENHCLECADNHIVFKDDYSEVFVKDLKIDDSIITKYGSEVVKLVTKTNDTESMFDLSVESDEHRYYTNDILSHNTTIGSFYLLYEACFPEAPGDILLVAHKQAHSQEVLKRMKDMYYSMPMWMKPGRNKCPISW